jgi:tellurite resistance protein
MGLAGLTIAWEKAHSSLQLSFQLDTLLLPLTGLVFLLLLSLYTFKLIRYRAAVVKELQHPIKLNFFPTISISLVLLSIAGLHVVPGLSKVLWMVGSGLHLIFTLYVMDVWIHHDRFQINHMNPAWFIPVVGNVLIPIAGTSHGFSEISWFFFSIGILFWLVLFTIIIYRVLFHQSLDERMMPTFFILIAPPAVGFIAYLKLTESLDPFARVLYFSGLFLTLLLLTQARRFSKLKFFLSWWAYSFPLAAITIATLVMFETTGIQTYSMIAWGLLILLTGVVTTLIFKTANGVLNHRICKPE